MPKSLKDANRLPLAAVMIANMAVYYGAVRADAVFGADWLALVNDWMEMLPGGMALVVTSILNAQLSNETKARLVFWKWSNPLPGCEAFTRYAGTDPRVNLLAIERAHRPLPTDPTQQNALWYRLYKTVRDDPSVSHVQRNFLFARDYACLSLLLLVVLGTAGFFQIPSTETAFAYLAVPAAQYLLARRAASDRGRRFITTVLALNGAEA